MKNQLRKIFAIIVSLLIAISAGGCDSKTLSPSSTGLSSTSPTSTSVLPEDTALSETSQAALDAANKAIAKPGLYDDGVLSFKFPSDFSASNVVSNGIVVTSLTNSDKTASIMMYSENLTSPTEKAIDIANASKSSYSSAFTVSVSAMKIGGKDGAKVTVTNTVKGIDPSNPKLGTITMDENNYTYFLVSGGKYYTIATLNLKANVDVEKTFQSIISSISAK